MQELAVNRAAHISCIAAAVALVLPLSRWAWLAVYEAVRAAEINRSGWGYFGPEFYFMFGIAFIAAAAALATGKSRIQTFKRFVIAVFAVLVILTNIPLFISGVPITWGRFKGIFEYLICWAFIVPAAGWLLVFLRQRWFDFETLEDKMA